MISKPHHSLGTRILRGAVSSFFIGILSNGFLFAGQIIIPRVLSRVEYAQFTVSISFVAILALLADLGMNPFFTRMFAEAEEEAIAGSEDRRGTILGSAIALRLIMSLVVAGLVIVLGHQLYPNGMLGNMAILLITLIISSRLLIVRSVGEAVLRSLGKYYLAASFALIDAIAFATLLILGKDHGISLTGVIWIYTLCNLPGFILIVIAVGTWVRRNQLQLRVDYSFIGMMLRTALPLSLGTAFLTIHNEADKLLLDKLSNPIEVSAYGATIRLLTAASPLPLVLAAVTAPELTRLLLRKDVERSSRLTDMAIRILLTVAGAIAVFVTAANQEIIVLLLGVKYASAASLLTISSWMLLPIFMAWYTCEMSIAAGTFRPWTIYNGIIMILVVAGDLLLIPSLGAQGAMISKLTAISVGCAFLLFLQREVPYFNVRKSLAALLKIVVSIGMALVVAFILTPFDLNGWFSGAIALLVYFAMVHFTKTLSLKETASLMKRLRATNPIIEDV